MAGKLSDRSYSLSVVAGEIGSHVGAVVGVFVGQPAVIGHVRGRPVESGIAKAPMSADRLDLAPTNLAGDRQADLIASPTLAESWRIDLLARQERAG